MLSFFFVHFSEIQFLEQNYDIAKCSIWMKKVAEIQNKVGWIGHQINCAFKALKQFTFLVNKMNGPAWKENYILEFEEHDFTRFNHHHL